MANPFSLISQSQTLANSSDTTSKKKKNNFFTIRLLWSTQNHWRITNCHRHCATMVRCRSFIIVCYFCARHAFANTSNRNSHVVMVIPTSKWWIELLQCSVKEQFLQLQTITTWYGLSKDLLYSIYIYITTNEESFDDFTFHLIYILLTKLITFTRAYSNTHWFCFWHSPPLQRTFHLKRIAVTKNFILFLTSVARKAVHMWHRFNSICNVLKAIYLEHAPLLQVSSFSVRLVTTAVCAKSTCPTSATISVHCITINIMLLNVGWCATTCIPHEYSDTSQKFCIRSGLASQQHQHSATACKYFCVYMRCGGTCFCIVEYCGILLGFTYYNSYNAEIDESIKSVVIYSIITIFVLLIRQSVWIVY